MPTRTPGAISSGQFLTRLTDFSPDEGFPSRVSANHKALAFEAPFDAKLDGFWHCSANNERFVSVATEMTAKSAYLSLADPKRSNRTVGSRTGARSADGGSPSALFQLSVGYTVPPPSRFQFPPRQSERADFPRSAFLRGWSQGL
jgi:hypothetical protein